VPVVLSTDGSNDSLLVTRYTEHQIRNKINAAIKIMYFLKRVILEKLLIILCK
jgi:hypothetical protein